MSGLSRAQVEALADARANSGERQTGLHKGGTWWYTEGQGGSHHHNTVQSLIERGYLRTWVRGTIAHITDAGVDALADFIEEQKA